MNLGGGVTRYTWAAGENCEAGYQHFRRQNGGHDVPDFATSAIWEFVSQHRLDSVIDCVDDSIPGDTNDDGAVDGQDLARILAQWNTSAAEADLNLDGIVNGQDLSIVLAYWTG